MLTKSGESLDAVVSVDVPDSIVIERLLREPKLREELTTTVLQSKTG